MYTHYLPNDHDDVDDDYDPIETRQCVHHSKKHEKYEHNHGHTGTHYRTYDLTRDYQPGYSTRTIYDEGIYSSQSNKIFLV